MLYRGTAAPTLTDSNDDANRGSEIRPARTILEMGRKKGTQVAATVRKEEQRGREEAPVEGVRQNRLFPSIMQDLMALLTRSFLLWLCVHSHRAPSQALQGQARFQRRPVVVPRHEQLGKRRRKTM